MSKQPKITIAIADDHTIMRNGLAELIKTMGAYEVVLQAHNGRELLELLQTTTIVPDICILDINMPELNGYETTAQLKQHYPSIKVMALSMFDNEFSIVRMLRSGAKGFLHKGADPDELSNALQTLHTEGYFHTELMLINSLRKSNNWQTINITDRETEFLRYCCSDLSYKEIADLMKVSLHTVHGYRDALFLKLRLKSRTALAIYALRTGVVTD
ncbi:response regulator transcription factor [Taibaiella koreensis]|uniref:response regulator transcription factor n=1 Tax=Taibaiella koreensis TaxID=1268548 RepID=UPI000E5A0437|nr:response regulator transcription factor [Taibaiella koreensis]